MTTNEILFLLLKEALFNKSYPELPTEKDINIWYQVYSELQKQAVLGITAPVVVRHNEIPEALRNKWYALQKSFSIRYVQMAAAQNEACEILQGSGIKVAVMKGMAAAIYYPVPDYRVMGDIDLLISPNDYNTAIELLKNNGYHLLEKEGDQYHTALKKYNVLFEVHHSPAGTHIAKEGDIISEYILSGLDNIEINTIGQDQFPILPWKQNGMELIWHIRQHLYNGLGLRHIIDWMMFVNYYLDDERIREYMPDLRKCGLDQLAIVVTKMCQKYLGLSRQNITWSSGADEALCDDLMNFIMEQGNFGVKAMDEKTAKVLSGYSNPKQMWKKLQYVGETEWKALKKYPVLKPVAFIYGGVQAIKLVHGQKGGLKKLFGDLRLGQRRKKMFSKLYETSENNFFHDILVHIPLFRASDQEKNINNLHRTKGQKSQFKLFMWSMVNRINKHRGISSCLKQVSDLIAAIEDAVYDVICLIQGYRMPSKEERKLVRENVTFIYKSFERQKMATQLYRNIQKYYPGTYVIIADDSRKPLEIRGKYVTVIHLPFNSGLSYGLNQALRQVKTPYVIRLDDDHLLTRRTHVGEQMKFLKEHPEVDLVGFGLLNAVRFETPKQHIRKFYPQSMYYAPRVLKIPHLTRIDKNHLVLGKGFNLFLIETDTLRKIGYDDEIRMIDHDDFFYRAAGKIVSVVAEDTRVFHRHNLFDSHYSRYRNDTAGDANYIWISRQKQHKGKKV